MTPYKAWRRINRAAETSNRVVIVLADGKKLSGALVDRRISREVDGGVLGIASVTLVVEVLPRTKDR